MARTGYLNAGVNPTSATSTTDLRTFLSSNLTTWTPSALRTFDTGSTERNYYVLSHSTSNAEILVIHPPGGAISMDLDGSILSAYVGEGGESSLTDRTLSFAYSPGGGYDARFVAGDDPLTDTSFWPADSSQAFSVQGYSEGDTSLDLYFFEESTHAELTIYAGDATSGLGMVVLSDALYTPTPGSTYDTTGIWCLAKTNGTGSPRPLTLSRMVAWTGGVASTLVHNPKSAGLTALTDSNQPASDGTYLTRRMGVVANDQIVAVINDEYALECGRMTSTYATKLGPAAQPYVHVLQDLFTPWSQGLAAPTLS